MNKPNVNAQIIGWLFLLQKFDIIIVNNLGKENVVIDLWSRPSLSAENEEMVDDQLLDEKLFSISLFSP